MKNIFKIFSLDEKILKDEKRKKIIIFSSNYFNTQKKAKIFINYSVSYYNKKFNNPNKFILTITKENIINKEKYFKIFVSNKGKKQYYNNFTDHRSDTVKYNMINYVYFYKKIPTLISSNFYLNNFGILIKYFSEEEFKVFDNISKIFKNIEQSQNNINDLKNKYGIEKKILILKNKYYFNIKAYISDFIFYNNITTSILTSSTNNDYINNIMKLLENNQLKLFDIEKKYYDFSNKILPIEIQNCFYDYLINYFNKLINIGIRTFNSHINKNKKKMNFIFDNYKKETGKIFVFKTIGFVDFKKLCEEKNMKIFENDMNLFLDWFKKKEYYFSIFNCIIDSYNYLKKFSYYFKFRENKKYDPLKSGFIKTNMYFLIMIDCMICKRKMFPNILISYENKKNIISFKRKIVKYFGYEKLKTICFDDCKIKDL